MVEAHSPVQRAPLRMTEVPLACDLRCGSGPTAAPTGWSI
jgi:hypothetical protein